MHLRKGLLCSVLWAVAALASAAANDSPDTATLYLKAWSFKDYATMRDLTAPSARQNLDESRFFGAAGRLPAPGSEPKILSRTPKGAAFPGAETVYFEYSAPEATGPVRSSIVLAPEGVLHPELIGAASPAVGAAASAGATEQKTVDGETADSILQKMQKATDAAKTLQSDVAIRGSMLGTSVQETARLAYKAPDKIRLQSKSFIMNSDGARSTLYLPEANIYMNLSELGELELTPGIGMTAEEMREKYDVSLVGKGEVNGEPAYELRMKSPTSGGSMPLLGQGSGKMTLWVSAKSWLPVRAALDGMKVDYQNMQVNAGEIDDTTFEFKPPAGANAFSLGGLMGALGGGGLPEE